MCKKKAMYQRCIGSYLILVGVYVDNMVVTWTSMSIISKCKQAMATNFDMIDPGVLRYYLCIESVSAKR